MSTITPANLDGPVEVAVPAQFEPMLLPPTADGRVLFSRTAYHRMAEAGILDPEKRFELIDGEIYMMSPIGAPQGGYISRLMKFFILRLPSHLDCRIQLSMAIGDRSEPEPDLAIVRLREDDYISAIPVSSDVRLLVEVAHSSIPFDLGKKLRLYAEAGIPEYWVLDVEHQLLLIHREPAGQQYNDTQQLSSGATVAPLAAPECQLDIAWLFR
jgi:Uma2 family endonuclease